MNTLAPFTEQELFEAFHDKRLSASKHLLTIYSIAVGLNAQRIADLGVGATTRALRAAARVTGGKVMSCDGDLERFSALREEDPSWDLALESSETFLSSIEPPIDMLMHDGAHDYFTVVHDLEIILPKMRTFGVVCIHDTQETDLGLEMMNAVRTAIQGAAVTLTHLPFAAGLTVLRVERSIHAPIKPAGTEFTDGRFDTLPSAGVAGSGDAVGRLTPETLVRRWARRRARKLVKGF